MKGLSQNPIRHFIVSLLGRFVPDKRLATVLISFKVYVFFALTHSRGGNVKNVNLNHTKLEGTYLHSDYLIRRLFMARFLLYSR